MKQFGFFFMPTNKISIFYWEFPKRWVNGSFVKSAPSAVLNFQFRIKKVTLCVIESQVCGLSKSVQKQFKAWPPRKSNANNPAPLNPFKKTITNEASPMKRKLFVCNWISNFNDPTSWKLDLASDCQKVQTLVTIIDLFMQWAKRQANFSTWHSVNKSISSETFSELSQVKLRRFTAQHAPVFMGRDLHTHFSCSKLISSKLIAA